MAGWTAQEEETLRMEYAGSPGKRLARKLGRTQAAVRAKAHRMGLYKGKILANWRTIVLDYHREGLTDCEMASRIGIERSRAWRWRTKLGLPANGRFGVMSRQGRKRVSAGIKVRLKTWRAVSKQIDRIAGAG